MSAVTWVISTSMSCSVPSASCASRASIASVAAAMTGKATCSRACAKAGSIIARWRRHCSPLVVKMLSPSSGSSAWPSSSLFGKSSACSTITRRTRPGSLTM